MNRMRLGAALVLCSIFAANFGAAQTGRAGADGSAHGESLAFARSEKLKRGINASEWFAQVYDKPGYTPQHFLAWTTADDIALIKSMGFDHVRLSVNPQPMMNDREPNKILEDHLASLDAAVKMILGHGLAIVIDLHPETISRRACRRTTSLWSASPISGGRWLRIIRHGMPTTCFLRL